MRIDGGTRLYDELAWIWPLLSPPEDYLEEGPAYIELFDSLGMPAGGSLLHLGSGGGSLDANLKHRYQINGIDASERMIEIAQGINPECTYLKGDLRTYRSDERFEGVLLHDAIAYMASIEDLGRAFVTAAHHLPSGGAFLCLPEQVQEKFVQNRVQSQTHGDDQFSVTTMSVEYDPDPDDTWFDAAYLYLVRRGPEFEVLADRHRIGMYPLKTFAAVAREAGLDVEIVEMHLPSEPTESYPMLKGLKR